MHPLGVLHALAAELAAKVIQTQQVQQLRKLNHEFTRYIEKKDLYLALEYGEKFHNLIVEIAKNPYIATLCSSLQMYIRRFKCVFLKQPLDQTSAAVHEHEQIVDALEKGDEATAVQLIKQNLSTPSVDF